MCGTDLNYLHFGNGFGCGIVYKGVLTGIVLGVDRPNASAIRHHGAVQGAEGGQGHALEVIHLFHQGRCLLII